MISELIVTSAPRGLQAGRSGFTTVLRTRGMHPDLASRLEAASAYRHVFPQGDSRNPVILSYTTRPSAIGDVWVLSRVGDAGTDYTGRSNKIAHHIAVQEGDVAALGQSNPAAVLAALVQSGGLLSRWDGEPREGTTPPRLPSPPSTPSVCKRWGELTGDPGWAGVLVERALSREATWIIAPAGVDLLQLFAEALALVSPAQRWHIPFTTYSLRGDEGRWLGTNAGSPEAETAASQSRIAVVDLTRRATVPTTGPYVFAARGQATVPWQRTASVANATKPQPLVPVADPSLAQQMPPSRQASVSVGNPQAGPPPILPRGGMRTSARPPDLLEWEDVPLKKPKMALSALMVAGTLSLLCLAICAGGAAAYRFKWLPPNMQSRIALLLWQQGYGDPPSEVAAAKVQRDLLNALVDEVKATVGESEINAHPFLPKGLEELIAHSKEITDLLADDNALRKVDLGVVDKATKQATQLIEQFGFLLEAENPGLLEAHIKASKAVTSAKAQNASKPDVDDAAKALRQALSNKQDKQALEKLLQDLEQAVAAAKKTRSEGKGAAGQQGEAKQPSKGPPAPDSPTVFSALRTAADKAHHLPQQTLVDSETGKPVTLLAWAEQPSSDSLQKVRLFLPNIEGDGTQSLRLEKLDADPNKPLASWRCVLENRDGQLCIVGDFEITESKLVFERNKEAPDDLAGLPYLPLCLAEADESTDGSKPTWVQLMHPMKLVGDHSPESQEQQDSALTDESQPVQHGSDVVAIPLGPLSISSGMRKHLVLSDFQITIKLPDDPIHIAPHGTFHFGTTGTFSGLRLDDPPLRFWWRPRAAGTPTGNLPSGFADLGWLDWEQGEGQEQRISLQILWERMTDPVTMNIKRQNEDVKNEDWTRELERLAFWGFKNDLLPKQLDLPNSDKQKSHEILVKAVGDIVGEPNEMKGKDKWSWANQSAKRAIRVDELTHTLRESGGFRLYVTEKLGLPQSAPPKPKKPDGSLSPQDANRQQQEYDAAIALFNDYEKKVRDGCADDTNLRLWVEDVLMGSGSERSYMPKSGYLHMWLWRYLYRLPDALPPANQRAAKPNSRKPWISVLKTASITIEGDVVYPWKQADFDGETLAPEACKTLVATSRPTRPLGGESSQPAPPGPEAEAERQEEPTEKSDNSNEGSSLPISANGADGANGSASGTASTQDAGKAPEAASSGSK